MAFPSVRSSNTTNGNTASATPVINLPATIRAGDTILVVFRVAVAGVVGWPDASWHELFDASPDASDDQFAAAWRKADGTEGTTITLSCTSGKFGAFAIAVQDATDPEIRPPELSTVATGTSAAQPNATTCTPTGGAKDYLWFTFFGMEGEATGITSYPANYTLEQLGLISSGTGGAVTTNVRLSGAGRQLNAASEDAGAWTVAGTLDDWSAYTIAFHPAAPIDAGLENGRREQPTYIPPRTFLGLAGLTLAVNLLQSTLAPIEPVPYNQYDWPNPTKITSQLVIDINTAPSTDADIAFVPIDWRNPDGFRYPISNRTEINNLLQTTLKPEEANPLINIGNANPALLKPTPHTWIQTRPYYYEDLTPNNQYDWPNPLLKGQQNRGSASKWIHLVEPQGFNQFDWPNPQYKGRPNVGFTSARPQYYEDLVPANQYDWPNPAQRKPKPTDLVFNKQIEPPTDFPFVPVDYPNPKIKGLPNIGSASARPQYYTDNTPANQYDWPNPLLQKKTALTWTNNLLENTLAPIGVAPFNQTNWPPGYTKAGLITEISSGVGSNPPESPLVRQLDWPLPRRAIKPALTWINTSTTLTTPPNPNNPPIWLVPPAKKEYSQRGWTYSQQLTRIVGNPFTPVLYPNPLIKQRIRQDAIVSTPNYYVSATGFSCQITFGIGAPGDISCFILIGLAVNPQAITTNVTELPALRKKQTHTWLQTRQFFYTDNYPISEQITDIPVVRRKPAPNTWIQSRPTFYVEPTGRPFQNNWANPHKRWSLIVDGNTFSGDIPLPVAGKPFNQLNWPNPNRKKLYNYKHETYFVFDNNNPNPAQYTFTPPIRRKPIAFTWITTPLVASPISNLPVGEQLFSLPRTKKVDSLTWLQTSLSVTETPFNQTDYPNPRVNKYALTWIQNKPTYYDETIPSGSHDLAIPIHVHPPTQTWINVQQVQETDPTRNYEWLNPLIKKQPTNSWLIDLLQSTLEPAVGVAPFAQTNYPNPDLRKPKGEFWSNWFVVDENQPTPPLIWPNPLVRLTRNTGLVQSKPTYYTDLIIPHKQLDWPLPQNKRRQTLQWLQNSLLGTLSPQPFNRQTNWPNPLRGKVNRVDYTRDVARFLDSKTPFRFVEWPVSKKKELAKTWIDNPVLVLNAETGVKPISQTDWPLFRKSKYVAAVYIIQNQITILIPNIVGRGICLQADATEYNLAAALDLLDFLADETDYNLEAGGPECQ